MGPIPGGALEGEAKTWPEDWAFTTNVENILIETNPQDPYSVTLWGVEQGGHFYVGGTSEKSRWVKNLIKHGYVVLSISGSLYAGRATEVTDRDEVHAVLDRYVTKYDFEFREDDNFIEDEGILFRLSAR